MSCSQPSFRSGFMLFNDKEVYKSNYTIALYCSNEQITISSVSICSHYLLHGSARHAIRAGAVEDEERNRDVFRQSHFTLDDLDMKSLNAHRRSQPPKITDYC